ncbi:uncharacterized mitochondrial protein AtMg00300-like [Humulus lupulus]|uniref:uncharacterized mitochondrial protein AtMg00300-like n=1 Tax=Humulus lupulus TaxID=3486 RepID=UPI002B403A8D|nr:uncharacterized mitochondrial protein AtMg00300-like [Humulus lupulus]
MVIMKGIQKNGLYSLVGDVVIGSVATVSARKWSQTEMWHRRLVHVSERGLIKLEKQNLLCGDKVEKLEFCEHCVYGKACRVKFSLGQQRTKGSLDNIHADLWGPSRTPSHSGARKFGIARHRTVARTP